MSTPPSIDILRWFAEQGIKAPHEVSVVGFEGIKPDSFTHPPLTTVAHSFPELARRAAKMLWQETTERALVPPSLVVRESTMPCPESRA